MTGSVRFASPTRSSTGLLNWPTLLGCVWASKTPRSSRRAATARACPNGPGRRLHPACRFGPRVCARICQGHGFRHGTPSSRSGRCARAAIPPNRSPGHSTSGQRWSRRWCASWRPRRPRRRLSRHCRLLGEPGMEQEPHDRHSSGLARPTGSRGRPRRNRVRRSRPAASATSRVSLRLPLDTYCLGVKNHSPKVMNERDLPGFLRDYFTPFAEVGGSLAVPLPGPPPRVGSGRRRPQPRLRTDPPLHGRGRAPRWMGGDQRLTFGRDATPVYVAGPYDNPRAIIAPRPSLRPGQLRVPGAGPAERIGANRHPALRRQYPALTVAAPDPAGTREPCCAGGPPQPTSPPPLGLPDDDRGGPPTTADPSPGAADGGHTDLGLRQSRVSLRTRPSGCRIDPVEDLDDRRHRSHSATVCSTSESRCVKVARSVREAARGNGSVEEDRNRAPDRLNNTLGRVANLTVMACSIEVLYFVPTPMFSGAVSTAGPCRRSVRGPSRRAPG